MCVCVCVCLPHSPNEINRCSSEKKSSVVSAPMNTENLVFAFNDLDLSEITRNKNKKK